MEDWNGLIDLVVEQIPESDEKVYDVIEICDQGKVRSATTRTSETTATEQSTATRNSPTDYRLWENAWPRFKIVSRKRKINKLFWHDLQQGPLKVKQTSNKTTSHSSHASLSRDHHFRKKENNQTVAKESLATEGNRNGSKHHLIVVPPPPPPTPPPPPPPPDDPTRHTAQIVLALPGAPVTLQDVTETEYSLQLPPLPVPLKEHETVGKDGVVYAGVTLVQEGEAAKFQKLQRPASFHSQLGPRMGDTVISVDGKSVQSLPYHKIMTQLQEKLNKKGVPAPVRMVRFQRKVALESGILQQERPELPLILLSPPNDQCDYGIFFPVSKNGLGIALMGNKQGQTLYDHVVRRSAFGPDERPRRGDILQSINGESTRTLSFRQIIALLQSVGGKEPCLLGFQRAQHREDPVTMKEWAHENWDYVLCFPPSSIGLGLRIERGIGPNTACFLELDRVTDFGSTPQPPVPGDIVTTVNGVIVERFSFKQIQTLLSQSGLHTGCTIGFRRVCQVPS